MAQAIIRSFASNAANSKQHLDNLRRKDSLRGAATTEISVRLRNYSASHFEGSALVVEHWASAVASSSSLACLSLHAMWTRLGRLRGYKILSILSAGCDFTTPSGGICAVLVDAGVVCPRARRWLAYPRRACRGRDRSLRGTRRESGGEWRPARSVVGLDARQRHVCQQAAR